MRPASIARSALLVSFLATGCAAPRAVADGGVAWESWRPEAFARAKAENRLVLVDVVAEWCHWCHVMDKTTYADAGVVSLLAADFLPIRVDSDARPDVAERYREWGWPATAILTPDAKPVLELRGYQEPAEFAELLKRTSEDFRAGRPIAREPVVRKAAANADLERIRETVKAQLDRYYDTEEDGWGRPQKYPVPAPVEFSFEATWLSGEAGPQQRALATLARELALVDPVWGGMYQYSTHGDWAHPHFEKIVPVQAGAISNFAQAYAATGDKRWLDAAKAVRRFVKEFLTTNEGAFGSSQDADVGAHGDAETWIDGHDYFGLPDAERRAKGIPRLDMNVYADRNGMLVQALAELYEASREEETIQMARKAAAVVEKSHAGPIGGFTHAAAEKGVLPILHLADQVAMGRAWLALANATGDNSYVFRAEAVAQTLRDRFEDKAAGGFFANTADDAAVGVFAERRKPFDENARAARFLVRLHHFTGEELWKESAEKALRFFADPAAIDEEGRSVGDYLLALDELAHAPLHLEVVGKAGAKETIALRFAALAVYAPGKVVKVSAPGDMYPDIGKTAVYICSDKACSSPVTDPAKVGEEAKATLAVGR